MTTNLPQTFAVSQGVYKSISAPITQRLITPEAPPCRVQSSFEGTSTKIKFIGQQLFSVNQELDSLDVQFFRDIAPLQVRIHLLRKENKQIRGHVEKLLFVLVDESRKIDKKLITINDRLNLLREENLKYSLSIRAVTTEISEYLESQLLMGPSTTQTR